MLVEIRDDFDLERITLSGQCFRAKRMDDTYRFITGDDVLYMQRKEDHAFSVSCSAEKWKAVWKEYFDLDRCYNSITAEESGKHPFIDAAMAYGKGLRILSQDPWEMLITFIISQRKNIPAIASSVEKIASKFGHPIRTDRETVFSFPTPQEMANATEQSLLECGLGYRAQYVIDALSRVLTGVLDLESLSSFSDDQLLQELQSIRGVGKKVANCVALFAYGRTSCVPIDVWISRAIEDEFNGLSPFELFGENAGIIQQYVFYYEKRRQF